VANRPRVRRISLHAGQSQSALLFSGDTGLGKTSGMNGLLAALVRRNPTLGGVVTANKGDEWFYLEWLAKKYGRNHDIIRLRPRLVGETGKPLHRLNATGDACLPYTTRARNAAQGDRVSMALNTPFFLVSTRMLSKSSQ
jgi:hypothetical protein